jgi:hypothetical protein
MGAIGDGGVAGGSVHQFETMAMRAETMRSPSAPNAVRKLHQTGLRTLAYARGGAALAFA